MVILRLLTRPAMLLAITFAALIAAGTVLLMLPACHGQTPVRFIDALFTATSAVCVTGLSTIEGGAASFSKAGQLVILVLIQLGGLGLMTFGAFAAQIFRLRVSFSSQAALQDLFFQTETRGNINAALKRIIALVFVFELLGAIFIYSGIRDDYTYHTEAAFDSVFLSVSAFCNAGFSVYSDSAESLASIPVVMITLMALIILGGLGYTVLFEILGRLWHSLRGRSHHVRWSLNTRVVLAISLVLTVGGAGLIMITGLSGTDEHHPVMYALHGLFQSVTARTAGFNTIPINAVPVPTLLILLPLMFIGGSPGSTAGGIKTTSLVVWGARMRARLSGREHVNVNDRHIPHDIVRKAALIVGVAALWCCWGSLILSITEPVGNGVRFEHVVFEQVSAFATVGLSAGLTPHLSVLGKIWIILSMFVGRLGPLTVALAVMPRPRPKVSFPEERVMIG